ncbi:uncharacterized protein N0V89_008971 [Didymosphaeria variabile]|uniref:Rhodopsin domain-containing protein n=1 Tax=Didymosphaeria variabile TaxID=1932322 RepID=A0A9W8XHA2_9PLEO|nr:uncharacterized protein N0V89_008971 [Didymosphaeria variabile]KAJ4350350.1 hypothetical protein N0V89_008971 [Didymosphaeria variabile]
MDLNQPVATPPAGHVSNFDHPQNEAALAYTTLALSLATVTLFCWFRFLVKHYIMGKLYLEDYLIPPAWIAAIVHIACGFQINQFAPIIHSWDMTMLTFGKYLMWYRISSIFYNIAIVLIKVAMLIQVLRIFVPRGSQSKTYYVVHGLIWMNVLYYSIIVFLMLFNCQPIQKAWKPWLPGKCMQIGIIAMSTAVVNLIGDLSILFLTQKVIWNLMRVERRQRLKLSIVFLAGIVPCGFAVMCLYYNDKQMHSTDFTRDSMYMSIACYGEIASGMFVLFLPVVPKFFTHLKTASSFSRLSTKRTLASSDGGNIASRGGGVAKKKSLFHISYTQKESDEKLVVNVTSTVSVRTEMASGVGVGAGVSLRW